LLEGVGELQSKSKLGFDQVVANSHGFLWEIMSMHKQWIPDHSPSLSQAWKWG